MKDKKSSSSSSSTNNKNIDYEPGLIHFVHRDTHVSTAVALSSSGSISMAELRDKLPSSADQRIGVVLSCDETGQSYLKFAPNSRVEYFEVKKNDANSTKKETTNSSTDTVDHQQHHWWNHRLCRKTMFIVILCAMVIISTTNREISGSLVTLSIFSLNHENDAAVEASKKNLFGRIQCMFPFLLAGSTAVFMLLQVTDSRFCWISIAGFLYAIADAFIVTLISPQSRLWPIANFGLSAGTTVFMGWYISPSVLMPTAIILVTFVLALVVTRPLVPSALKQKEE